MSRKRSLVSLGGALTLGTALAGIPLAAADAQPQKRPNIVMLMTDDTGWNDFGPYSNGGKALGHPTPNVDRIAEEGATFTNWYGQASCTAGRASFMTGRIPIRSALSIVVAPADPNFLRKETPTIAEFFKKNGYSTYFSGKWHLGDVPESYPIEHGFDEMKNFAAYYAGVYTYDYTNKWFHPWFPSYNPQFKKYFSENVNLNEWEGVAGQPAKSVGRIDFERFQTFDEDQAANAVAYIKKHANDDKPFFMDVNYLKMHNPTNASPRFAGKSKLGDYSDSLMELDADIGVVMDEIRKDAPNTIVIVTADNGAWLDAFPDAGTTPFRGEKGSPFEGGWRVPGIMWWPGHIPARAKYDEMMSHIDAWATLSTMVGVTPPPHEWVGNDGKPIYFDSIDNSDYILGKSPHSARRSWIYIDGETFWGARADIGGDPDEPWVNIAWKYLYTARDSWLGVNSDLGAIGATYNLTMDPYEKYDMTFNGAAPVSVQQASPGKYAGQDNGWVLALISPVMIEFDKSVMKFPNIRRYVGGASTDLRPNLQDPSDPVPLLRKQIEDGKLAPVQGGGG
ncbi:arylsulfatase [Roseiarcus fermentans]|jgi:arylsulfatase|uniref:Arylsulfatase n=1 Tax=Roseiarcus fermentans TaxID=1473586 RepID=A0A366FEL0_9HYPH|nr:arylsulfatase [Roseiarcus fermentans]RBP13104.1 arylsulfatase [Roseiarcus fermentans]